MKKKLLTLTSLILIVVIVINNGGIGVLGQTTTYAAGDLIINWYVPSGDPIFVVNNMLPGDIEDRDVDVSNGGSEPREVGVKGEKTSETASFSAVLDFVIFADGTPIYGSGSSTGSKTLQEFFNESTGINGLPLTTINNGDSTTYNFKATFLSDSGNEYQGASVVFDLKIGIIIDDIPPSCNLEDFDGPVIYGTSGDDRINGTSEGELIVTFEGNDRVNAGGGNDFILTGSGNDRVDGQTGDDCIYTEEGDDKVSASNGVDIIYGGDGNDNIDGGTENDIIYGGNGNDKIKGGRNNDLIYGENGNDKLEGGTHDDKLYGGDGDDEISGGSGNDEGYGENDNDELSGGSGDDLLIGGNNIDEVNGGSGTDTCDAETESSCEL